jgi:hypothetical protein
MMSRYNELSEKDLLIKSLRDRANKSESKFIKEGNKAYQDRLDLIKK